MSNDERKSSSTKYTKKHNNLNKPGLFNTQTMDFNIQKLKYSLNKNKEFFQNYEAKKNSQKKFFTIKDSILSNDNSFVSYNSKIKKKNSGISLENPAIYSPDNKRSRKINYNINKNNIKNELSPNKFNKSNSYKFYENIEENNYKNKNLDSILTSNEENFEKIKNLNKASTNFESERNTKFLEEEIEEKINKKIPQNLEKKVHCEELNYNKNISLKTHDLKNNNLKSNNKIINFGFSEINNSTNFIEINKISDIFYDNLLAENNSHSNYSDRKKGIKKRRLSMNDIENEISLTKNKKFLSTNLNNYTNYTNKNNSISTNKKSEFKLNQTKQNNLINESNIILSENIKTNTNSIDLNVGKDKNITNNKENINKDYISSEFKKLEIHERVSLMSKGQLKEKYPADVEKLFSKIFSKNIENLLALKNYPIFANSSGKINIHDERKEFSKKNYVNKEISELKEKVYFLKGTLDYIFPQYLTGKLKEAVKNSKLEKLKKQNLIELKKQKLKNFNNINSNLNKENIQNLKDSEILEFNPKNNRRSSSLYSVLNQSTLKKNSSVIATQTLDIIENEKNIKIGIDEISQISEDKINKNKFVFPKINFNNKNSYKENINIIDEKPLTNFNFTSKKKLISNDTNSSLFNKFKNFKNLHDQQTKTNNLFSGDFIYQSITSKNAIKKDILSKSIYINNLKLVDKTNFKK